MERQGHGPEVVAADLAWAAASLVRTTQRELGLRTTPDPIETDTDDLPTDDTATDNTTRGT